MKLNPSENRLDGKWELINGRLVKDLTCERIEKLIQKMDKVRSDSSGWDTLYRDPTDGRYWELVYLHSEMHGGGPPSLIGVSAEVLKAKYGIKPKNRQ